MEDRRSYDRLPLTGQINIRSKDTGPAGFDAFLDNISFGGFAMYAPERVSPGWEVEFDFDVPVFGQPLSGKGVIRHLDARDRYEKKIHSMGVEFTEVNKDAVMFIIKRLHLNKTGQDQKNQGASSLDFIPY